MMLSSVQVFFTAVIVMFSFTQASPLVSSIHSRDADAANDTLATASIKTFAYTKQAIINTLALSNGTSTLPEPTGLSLKYATIGRGVQNYTCVNSTAQAIPVAIGALAVLYDITAQVLLDPANISSMVDTAANMPASTFILRNMPLDIPAVGTYPVIGEHFFQADATPTFDLFVVGKRAFCKLTTKINAPETSSMGIDGTGSVAWLSLAAEAPSVGIAQVYRVLTAGGNAPPTCAGQAANISILYSAAYHFYA
ncbi:hypothetical protein BJ878DRAFT_546244 [Calycina marina]|uniref:Malate dehydrogenase n=1 Tax=Calycina marina TaxID=1763456 RepID=A0A9P7YUX3_9HELO|nr:hypothetical protein BJ878DRAFT_546244 [Calycina marina]